MFFSCLFLRKTDPQSSNYLNIVGDTFSLTTITFVRHFENEILLTINHGRKMSTISGNEIHLSVTLLNEFQDVLEGLGCVEGVYNIKLKANSHPTIQPQQNVPLRLMDKLKGTLNDLEQKDIIAKVEEPVTWVSNLVIVEKANKTMRLCLDPPDLNEAIEKEDIQTAKF